MKKIFTSVVALLVMGSVTFAQDAAKKPAKTKKTVKTETKMDAKAGTTKTTTATKMDSKMGGKKTKSSTKKTTETKAK